MKILVTGHRGFIGQNLVRYFLSQGHQVDGFDFVPNIIPDVTRYDWVVHAGAISDTTETDVDKVWEQNFEFTSRLIQVCDQFGVNIQISSTSAVYGPGSDGFKEDSKCLPQSPYAWSKFLIDKNIKDIGIEDNFAMTLQSFRYFNVYGPGEGHKGDQMSLVSKFQKQAAHDGVIKLFENSEEYERDCICVYDLCLIHDLMMQSDASGIFNVGTGRARNLREIAEVIAKQYDATIKEIPMPAHLQGQYQKYTQADLSELKKVIKLPEFTKIEDYIRDSDI